VTVDTTAAPTDDADTDDATPAAAAAPPPAPKAAPAAEEPAPAAPPAAPAAATAVVATAPDGLKGGWQALLKTKMKGKKPKKHNFPTDQAASIVQLVQTPSTYSAWKPGKTSDTDSAAAASAKSDLLAAEKAFDAEGDDDAPSFLQLRKSNKIKKKKAAVQAPKNGRRLRGGKAQANDKSSIKGKSAKSDDAARAASKLVLEKFASSLGSAALLELARANLDARKLKLLWKKIQAKASQGHDAHQNEEVRWCQEFKRQDTLTLEKKAAAKQKAILDQAQASVKHLVLEKSIKTQEQVTSLLSTDSGHLEVLLNRAKGEASAMDALFKRLRKELRVAGAGSVGTEAGLAELEDLLEGLGKAEGLATSAATEMQDLVQAALARKSDAAKSRNATLDQLRANLTNMKATVEEVSEKAVTTTLAAAPRQAEPAASTDVDSLLEDAASSSSETLPEEAAVAPSEVQLAATHAEGGVVAGGPPPDIQDHYRQMCTWTLQNVEAQKHKLAGETEAIHAALMVLGAK
jgi:hypothetical protein